jgi:hypothetical protein
MGATTAIRTPKAVAKKTFAETDRNGQLKPRLKTPNFRGIMPGGKA